ncbi:MAG: hypothetical protein RM021_034115 [Nostoc sp. EkiNYC01]|nr:hypothetical protein [Nostoc sp. EkiNYC01]
MQHLSQLLEINNSDLARVLRLSLHGLRAELQEALNTAKKEDPGISQCRELLIELDNLLEASTKQSIESTASLDISLSKEEESNSHNPFEPVIEPEEPPTTPTSTLQLQLNHLAEAFISDLELKKYLGNFQLQSYTDYDLWNEIQRLLLQVPITIAETWQKHSLKIVQEFGAVPDNNDCKQLPFIRNQLVYPGLSGSVQAQGLYLSKNLPLDPRIKLEQSDSDLYFLAGIVSTWIKYIEVDSTLHHALKSVYRFDVKPLNSEAERTKYVAVLLDCWQRAQLAEENQDLVASLRARLDLDEAIHSLVYLPPVERDSWWGKLQQEARRTLEKVASAARQAGFKVQIRSLWGPYADICAYSKDDLELDKGGIPGEVSACLRVYARINEEAYPGRVLFRSLR